MHMMIIRAYRGIKRRARNDTDNVNWTAADVAIPHAVCPSGDPGDKGLSKLVSRAGYGQVTSMRRAAILNDGGGGQRGRRGFLWRNGLLRG
jgi:hypothetical protein